MSPGPIHRVLKHLRHAAQPANGGERPDAELLCSFLEGRDETAFAALVRRHAAMVLGVCRRVTGDAHDAEDAFQAAFCVLLRKAGSIRRREVLGSWLYGVAYRTALAAKARRAKTRRRELQVDPMPQPMHVPADLDPGQDWQPLLDAALERLPEKYRVPIILCDLEGKSRREAALQLRVSEGTLSSRLARGRRLLAQRLQRHGLALSGGALAAILAESAASARVPVSLVQTVSQAGAQVIVGQAPTFLAFSAPVVALTEGVMKAMLIGKLKALVMVLVIGSLLTLGGLWLGGTSAAPAAVADEAQQPPAASSPPGLAPARATLVPAVAADEPQFRIEAFVALDDGVKKSKPYPTPAVTAVLGQRVSVGIDGILDVRTNPPQYFKISWAVEVVRQRGADVLVNLTLEKKQRQSSALVHGQSLEFEDFIPKDAWKIISDASWPGIEFKIKVTPLRATDRPISPPRTKATLQHPPMPADKAPPSAIALSPDGRQLAISSDKQVLLIDAQTGKLLSQSVGDGTPRALAFSPDGKMLVSGTQQGAVNIYDVPTGKMIRKLQSKMPIVQIQVSPDGRTVITITSDQSRLHWDMTTGELHRVEPPAGQKR